VKRKKKRKPEPNLKWESENWTGEKFPAVQEKEIGILYIDIHLKDECRGERGIQQKKFLPDWCYVFLLKYKNLSSTLILYKICPELFFSLSFSLNKLLILLLAISS